MRYIPLTTILGDYARNSGRKDETDEDSILQWASDFIQLMGTYNQYRYNVATLDVVDFKAKLPKDFHLIELLLFSDVSNCASKSVLELSEIIYPLYGESCSVKVTQECNEGCCGTITVDATEELKNSYPWMGYSRVVTTSNDFRRGNLSTFYPILSNDKAGLNRHLKDCNNLQLVDSSVTYKLEEDHIVCSVRTGTIMLFYLGFVVDDEGYPMIPDVIEYINTMYLYIEKMFAFREYSGTKTNENRAFFSDINQMYGRSFEDCKVKMNTPTWEEAKEIDLLIRQRIPQTSLSGQNLDYYKLKRNFNAGNNIHRQSYGYR